MEACDGHDYSARALIVALESCRRVIDNVKIIKIRDSYRTRMKRIAIKAVYLAMCI